MPAWAVSPLQVLLLHSVPELIVHGDAAPLSKPVLPSNCVEPPPPDELIVRLNVAVWLSEPEVPVIVTEAVPVVAVLLAVSVSVLVLVVLDGLNEAVTPLGRPEADKATLPLKPFTPVTVIVSVPLAPWFNVRLVGESDRLKSAVPLLEPASVVTNAAFGLPQPVTRS